MIAGWILAARQALVLISQTQPEAMATAPQQDVVALGQRLWWIIKHSDQILERVKARLRVDAAALGEGAQRFESPDGTHCMVHPETTAVEVRKDFDLGKLKLVLGDRLEDYFKVVTTYQPRKDFRELVAKAPPEHQAVLLESVTLIPRQSRVVFKD